jgi:hypothetical protein
LPDSASVLGLAVGVDLYTCAPGLKYGYGMKNWFSRKSLKQKKIGQFFAQNLIV